MTRSPTTGHAFHLSNCTKSRRENKDGWLMEYEPRKL